MGQPRADRRQRAGIVVPNLHRQRPGFVLHAPETIGELVAVLFDLQEAAGVDHLSGLQPGAAELADHLPIGVVGIARHGGLKQRRIDHHRADVKRPDAAGGQTLNDLHVHSRHSSDSGAGAEQRSRL